MVFQDDGFAAGNSTKEEFPMNILIVDQDPETLSQLAQILRKLLPQADICAYLHAEDYYAIAHKNSFELAFLAYPLHGWEPFSLEADLHKRYPLCNIILITQEVLLPSSVLNIYPSGALCKPFTSAISWFLTTAAMCCISL